MCGACGGSRAPAPWEDELWAAVDPSPAASTGEQRWARAAVPAGWDLQAATVWVADAAHAGTVTAAQLPAGGVVDLRDGGAAHVGRPAGPDVGVLGPDADAALAALLRFAGRSLTA